MDDSVVAQNATKASNGIIISIAIIAIAICLLFIFSLLFKIYYFINPKASPDYQSVSVKQEKEKKQETYVQERRNNATPCAVDLGLSVKWAEFNLGAYKSSDIGNYFYWAENKPSINGKSINKHINAETFGDISGIEEFDAATHIYGENWRLPTAEECKELLCKCTWEEKCIDGIEGRLVSAPNGNSIFLPYTERDAVKKTYTSGYYWTATPHDKIECDVNALRFGERLGKPAEIGPASANYNVFCIRPVFTTISKEMHDKILEEDSKRAYSLLQTSIHIPLDKQQYQYFKKQCKILKKEKCKNKPSYYGKINFDEENTIRDLYGVIYSLDGKRLLDASNCNCEIYTIMEGTEYICEEAFKKEDSLNYYPYFSFAIDSGRYCGISVNDEEKNKDLTKIILPSTLLFFSKNAIPNGCSIESKSPNYSVINGLLIDTRKKSIVMCLNKRIQKVEIYEPIEEIESGVFSNCGALREVILPDSLRVIGSNAFSNCGNLSRINLPDSVNVISESAFEFCTALQIDSLPKHLSYIGNEAFYGCIIKNVIIPKCIRHIGTQPFSHNAKHISSESSRFIINNSLLLDSQKKEVIQLIDSSKRSVKIPYHINKIRDRAFSGTGIETITISSNVVDLGTNLFSNCKELREVHFNCTIEHLPSFLFFNCSSLTSFNTPKCIKSIGEGAFRNCENLLEVSFNPILQRIENSAFEGCKNLQIVKINNGLRSIGPRAFAGCTNLSSIKIPESIVKIGELGGDCFKDCFNLKTFLYEAIEAEITWTGLPNSATEILIGNTVKILPENFLFKSKLISLFIPDNVKCIKKGCISCCENLKEISIAANDIMIEEGWISGCTNLRTIKLHVNVYDKLLHSIPKENRIKVKKIYGHKMLFFRW